MNTYGIDKYRYWLNILPTLSVDIFGASIVEWKRKLRGGCRRK